MNIEAVNGIEKAPCIATRYRGYQYDAYFDVFANDDKAPYAVSIMEDNGDLIDYGVDFETIDAAIASAKDTIDRYNGD